MLVQTQQEVDYFDENEVFWQSIRENIISSDDQRLYADWTASGQLYRPIEQRLIDIVGKQFSNTHSEDSRSGRQVSHWVEQSIQSIKQHVNADNNDVLISTGSGMTGALAKFIRLLGLWAHESFKAKIQLPIEQRPIVYITHREHHSNQTMWLESLAEVRVIPALAEDVVDVSWLEKDVRQHSINNRMVIASITAASNVTGVITPYREIARVIHRYNGVCFVDFAASAPYVEIDMHPAEGEWLDAVFFSPHKFLGGPGSEGVLVFNGELYQNKVPDQPGGGTVLWTNPWGEHRFYLDIEKRERGGTPGILQVIKTALAIQLKDEMGVDRILKKEQLMNAYIVHQLNQIDGVRILSGHLTERLSVFSIVFDRLSYRGAVNALSEKFGVEARGGCACAGTYGHYLLNIDYRKSHEITDQLADYDESLKPGWVRVSLHPSMNKQDLDRIIFAIKSITELPQEPPMTFSALNNELWQPLIETC